MPNIEKIEKDGKILAIVIRSKDSDSTINFVTPNEFPLQLGIHNRPKGDYVKAHEHVPFKNLDIPSQEIFFVEKGKIIVGLYDDGKKYKEVTVSDGEVIFLNAGHSLNFVEGTQAMEIKQGPYREKENEKIPLE